MAANDKRASDERRDERERHAGVEAAVVGAERATTPITGPETA